MSQAICFNDTFDNWSFTESGRYLNKTSEKCLKVAPEQKLGKCNAESDNDNCFKEENKCDTNEGINISVDDSVFLNESFSLCDQYVTEKQGSGVSSSTTDSKQKNDKPLENEKVLDTISSDKHNSEHIDNEKVVDTTQPSRDICDLAVWGLPDTILQKYKARSITQMFPWQAECLSNPRLLENNSNLIYSAPTSAGKTLVAEIIAIKTILERQKKVIFILPFVSVVREKMFYFQDLLGSTGVRVEGFMGSHNPPGGFNKIQVAICTIEKANGIINRLLEEGSLEDVGAVIVDEMHLLGDSSRGYLLELILTKLKYMTTQYETIHIQIVGMSATLPNLDLLGKWLKAEVYVTNFRPVPLEERCMVHGEIYNKKLVLERRLSAIPELDVDCDNILQLCLETLERSCSVLIFCPTKNWCENLAQQIAAAFWKLGRTNSPLGHILRKELNCELITELLTQLKRCPVGLDTILHKTVSYGVAFHHAGLTMDERDIIETAFRNCVLRVLVATSTLSSGVNLPARRVIIRTPMFHGKPIDSLVYKQMIGRAGRMGRDTRGESILICQKNDYRIAKELLGAGLQPIESCLIGAGRLKRAILEIVASGVAESPADVELFAKCTFLAVCEEDNPDLENPIEEAVEFLIRNEFIRLQQLEDGSSKYSATSLGKACLSSSMPPEEGLALFAELEKARECFVLETELHLVYLVTPYSACYQWGNIDWMLFLELWEKLPASMKRVGELVGVRESYLISGSRNKIQTNTSKLFHKLQVHKRFFVALALQDLVNEVPLIDVAAKFGCARGTLQSLQQSASTFAGMLTIFSRQLGWYNVEILISQFQDRLQFGVNRDLLDLMRLPILNGPRARALYNAGIETLAQLASSDVCTIENILYKVAPFESEKEREGESGYDANKRNKVRGIWITGKEGLTERDAAVMLIQDARRYLQLDMGLVEAKWDEINEEKSILNQSTNKGETQIKSSQTSNLIRSSVQSKSKIQRETENLSETKQTKKHYSHTTSNLMKNVTQQNNVNQNISSNAEKSTKKNKNDAIDLSSSNSEISFELRLSSESLSSVDSFINTEDKLKQKVSLKEAPIKALCTNERNVNLNIKLNQNEESMRSGFCDASSLETDVNNSDQSLFEDSFELKTIPKMQLPNENRNFSINSNRDSGLDFENVSFLENAFVSSFNLNEDVLVSDSQSETISVVDKSHKNNSDLNSAVPNEVFSPSNDMVYNSQTEGTCISHSKILEHSRKRERSDINNLNALNVELTPSKKRKMQDAKSDLISVPGGKLENSAGCDFTQIEIVDVCGTKELLNTFSAELIKKETVSFSFACRKMLEEKATIGLNVIKKTPMKTQKSQNTNFYYKDRQVVGFIVSWGNNVAYYVSFENKSVANSSKVSLLEDIFSKRNKIRIFDCKEQIKIAKLCCDVDFSCIAEDPKVADWLLDPEGKEKTLQSMAVTYAPETAALSRVAGSCKGVGSVGLDLYSSIEPRIRGAVEAIVTWHLCDSFYDVLSEQNSVLLETYETEMRSVVCLARMELTGIGIDKTELQILADNLKHHTNCLEKQAYSLAGRHFALTSPADVAKVLGMYKGRRVSTNKKTLEHEDNPIARLILQWRKVNSTLTKMVYPLIRLERNGRIHGCCIIHNSTGRISMHEPNLQNIPNDFEIENGTKISCRKVFVPAAQCVFLSADYCQLELRILAHLSQDPTLCFIMKSGEDVFKSVAAKWKNIEEKAVNDVTRQWAKQLCYGIIYGMGTKALADQLLVSEEEAAKFSETFREKYACINTYIKETVTKCRSLGYVETLAGRKRYLPNINHQNPGVKSQAERQAVNTTIQGSAADIAKLAMVLIEERFRHKFRQPKNLPKLILHIHDELLYEVQEKYVFKTAKILKKAMEEAVKLTVPLPVKLKSGPTWGSMEAMQL